MSSGFDSSWRWYNGAVVRSFSMSQLLYPEGLYQTPQVLYTIRGFSPPLWFASTIKGFESPGVHSIARETSEPFIDASMWNTRKPSVQGLLAPASPISVLDKYRAGHPAQGFGWAAHWADCFLRYILP